MQLKQPHRRVVIATDDADRATTLAALVDETGLIPEVCHCKDALGVELPVRAAIACITSPARWRPVLGAWAELALQPLTAVLLAPARGAVDLEESVTALGFQQILHWIYDSDLSAHGPSAARDGLAALLERDRSLLPLIARERGGLDATTAHLLAVVLDDPAVRTYARWAELAGLSPAQLKAHLGGCGLGDPRALAIDVRILRATYVSGSTDLRMDAIAARVGYSSGDYLGRLVKSRTGLAFRSLDLPTALHLLNSHHE